MKKVITSFGINEHRDLLALSIPTLYLYSQNHKYDLFIPNDSFFSLETKVMPPSWWKLDIIEYLFQSYDQVLWIDADVLICRFDQDISNDIDMNSDFGVVVHETPDGQIPNCGVWFLNKSCLSWLLKLKNHKNFKRSSCWWEQASLMYMLGMDPDVPFDNKLPETFPIKWTQLDYLWNPHINDRRKIPDNTRFFHSTGFRNRYSIMKDVLSQVIKL